jgi:hypothetical protein
MAHLAVQHQDEPLAVVQVFGGEAVHLELPVGQPGRVQVKDPGVREHEEEQERALSSPNSPTSDCTSDQLGIVATGFGGPGGPWSGRG